VCECEYACQAARSAGGLVSLVFYGTGGGGRSVKRCVRCVKRTNEYREHGVCAATRPMPNASSGKRFGLCRRAIHISVAKPPSVLTSPISPVIRNAGNRIGWCPARRRFACTARYQ